MNDDLRLRKINHSFELTSAVLMNNKAFITCTFYSCNLQVMYKLKVKQK